MDNKDKEMCKDLLKRFDEVNANVNANTTRVSYRSRVSLRSSLTQQLLKT